MDCLFLKNNKILQKINNNNNNDTKINKKQTIGQKPKKPKNRPKIQKLAENTKNRPKN
jgi:hypothetical protein